MTGRDDGPNVHKHSADGDEIELSVLVPLGLFACESVEHFILPAPLF